MFRKLLATTAITALMTAGALAQDEQQTSESMNKPLFNSEQGVGMDSETGFFEADASQILASDLLGMTVYNGSTDDAEAIGDINDVVMGESGSAEAVVIGIGGFLGIGEKEVAVDFAKISWIDRDGSRWLILDSSKEELEGAPAFDRTALLPKPADDTTDTAATEEQPAVTDEQPTDMAATEGVDPAETAAIDPSTWTRATTDQLSAEELIGTRVYGANDEHIGEIGDVIVTADGKFEAYVVDVGGFLGIGEKPVALGSEDLEILQDGNGGFHIRTAFTQEQLEGQTAYDENAYQENPDGNILR